MKVTKLTFGFLISLLAALLLLSACQSTQEVQYKTISFSDTNGVTTVYYPVTMEQYIIADDGKAKPMLVKP
tara:strand:- start:289 stop:501 length:213 start_codon:yes stop_codon:yes gene_type:complete